MIVWTLFGLTILSDDSISDTELLRMLLDNELSSHRLESVVSDAKRCVRLRREYVSRLVSPSLPSPLEDLGFDSFAYDLIQGRNCENVVGYVEVPVGVVGPLRVESHEFYVPLATTEGTLVASTQRGCKAICGDGSSISSFVLRDGMTRAPVVEMRSLRDVEALLAFVDDEFEQIAAAFESTSSFAVLEDIHPLVAGRRVHLRMEASTGDAMGMNMVSRGAEAAIAYIIESLAESVSMKPISVSGNACVDKKSSSVNWILGRGKSVVCEALVSQSAIESVLKTSVASLVDLWRDKNLVGSALAGGIGSQNAHASNIVSALFLACGQDIAQNVESSNCLTFLEQTSNGDLLMSCTMPSIEVGTVGGGTHLPSQSACLGLLGLKGSSSGVPGDNSRRLAEIVCATVMCGELSLLAALASGDLVRAHMKFNRLV